MLVEVDMHNHTLASGHAYNTITEESESKKETIWEDIAKEFIQLRKIIAEL